MYLLSNEDKEISQGKLNRIATHHKLSQINQQNRIAKIGRQKKIRLEICWSKQFEAV